MTGRLFRGLATAGLLVLLTVQGGWAATAQEQLKGAIDRVIKVLDDHERHGAFPRQSVEERVEGFDSPGRCADAHHREWQQSLLDEIIRRGESLRG